MLRVSVAAYFLACVFALPRVQGGNLQASGKTSAAKGSSTQKTPSKKPSAAAKKPAGIAANTRAGGSKKPATRRSAGRRARTGPSYQSHPTTERYQEIQKALADRGYFKGEINGVWGADSVEALKRFQVDQKITDDGQIGALSLIGLGLGPKHEGFPASTASNPAATSSPSGGVPPAEKVPVPNEKGSGDRPELSPTTGVPPSDPPPHNDPPVH